MNEESVKNRFLDLLDGSMTEEERIKLAAEIEADKELSRSFSQYRAIVELEEQLLEKAPKSAPDLTPGIMEYIADSKNSMSQASKIAALLSPRALIPAAGLAAACFALVFAYSLSTREGISGLSVLKRGADVDSKAASPSGAKEVLRDRNALEETLPLSAGEREKSSLSEKSPRPVERNLPSRSVHKKMKIPPGHRAVTIPMERRSGVEGFIRPNSRVDVLLKHKDSSGQTRVKSIAKGTKVASVSAQQEADKRSRAFDAKESVTVVVPEREAKKIEIAKSLGELNIAMPPQRDADRGGDTLRDELAATDLIGGKPQSPSAAEGAMLIQQPEGQKQMRYELKDNRWAAVNSRGSTMDRGASSYSSLEAGKNFKKKADSIYPSSSYRSIAPPKTKITRREGQPSAYSSVRPGYIPAPQTNEQYGIWQENPRQQVIQQPRSTFSIDVDTGSYTNARRFLQQGKLPPQESVRVEEFINYFDYNYPGQSTRPFSFHYEIAPAPFDANRHFLKLGIRARDARASDDKGWNVAFLIDVSGSMQSRNKLPLLKRSLKELVNQMRAGDRLSIITYANSARVVLSSASGTEKGRIFKAIDQLRAGGNTNGSAGIDLAYKTLERNRSHSGVNRIILATDGDFNQGTYSFNGLMRLIEQKRKSGISLTTLGFGTGNLKEHNLEQLADRGNGNYFYIDSFDEAKNVLTTKAVSNMETVAKDVKLQIEFNPKHVIEYRLVGYENRRLQNHQFSNDRVDAGEVGAGHTVTAVYEVLLAGSGHHGQNGLRYQNQHEETDAGDKSALRFSDEIGFLKIRYKEPNGDRSKLLEYPLSSKKIRSSLSEASDSFRFTAAVTYFAQLLRGSSFAQGYSYHDVAELAREVIADSGDDEYGHRAELLRLIETAASRGYRR